MCKNWPHECTYDHAQYSCTQYDENDDNLSSCPSDDHRCSHVCWEGELGYFWSTCHHGQFPATLSRIDPDSGTDPMRSNHNWCVMERPVLLCDVSVTKHQRVGAQKEPKPLLPERFLISKYSPKMFAAGVMPHTPLGSRTLAGFGEGNWDSRAHMRLILFNSVNAYVRGQFGPEFQVQWAVPTTILFVGKLGSFICLYDIKMLADDYFLLS